MRFIVDLYRYLIVALCGLILISLAYGTVAGIGSGLFDTPMGLLWALGLAMILIFLILSIGAVAIVISIHDRHAEAVDELERIADVLEWTRSDRLESTDV